MPERTWFDEQLAELEDDPGFNCEEMVFDYVNDIRRVMKEQGVSQTELARRLGRSRSYVSQVLNYTPNLTLKSLALIALALDCRWTLPRLRPRDEQPEGENQ
jgi:transcriptional regulator with XRE-family HTH domain